MSNYNNRPSRTTSLVVTTVLGVLVLVGLAVLMAVT